MEKVSDLSIISINASSTSDSGHGPVPSLAGPDALTPVQSIVPEAASANVFSQADHSPSLPQSSAQTAAAPVQAPPSGGSTSTDAYHALATDLTSNNLNVSIVSVATSSLEASIQQVLTNLQSGSGNQQVAQTASIAPASAAPDAQSSSSPSTFDAHADAILQRVHVNESTGRRGSRGPKRNTV